MRITLKSFTLSILDESIRVDWSTILCNERIRPSSTDGDHRAQFERDFDRAIFSTPLKRLQDKAQVFPLERHDAVRTRLTHSLEVSSVARGLAIAVGQWLLHEKHIERGMERSIEAIAATCGLIHDLGNPPFGHSGEDAIREWFAARFVDAKGESTLEAFIGSTEQHAKDFLTFEGNAQSLRLVSRLQILADPNGLNLTIGTLSAACKYLASSTEQNKKQAFKKTGYFASEATKIATIRKTTGTGLARNPITYLVEAADDIVYSAADVEDGIKKRVLLWRDVKEFVEKEIDDKALVKDLLEFKEKILKAGRDLPTDELPDDIHASAFRTACIKYATDFAIEQFKANYQKIMEGNFEGELINEADGKPFKIVRALKKLGQQVVYCTPSTLKLELMGRKVICDLMDVFWEGAEKIGVDKKSPPKPKNFDGKIGRLFSDNYLRAFYFSVAEDEMPENYLRLQLVTDQVCGMTDTFAKTLHAELFNG